MACNSRKYVQLSVFIRKFHTCLKLQRRQSLAAKPSTAKQSQEVVIPLRKKRDELSVLRALASTVQRDTGAPSYTFIDDPNLMPLSKLEQRLFAFSKASGQKAAQYVLHRYPQNFANDPAEPQIEALMPPTGPQLSDDTVEGLMERIEMRQPLAAHASYQKIVESGGSVPTEVVEDLLDLLCFYNSAEPPAIQYIEELYFQPYHSEKKKTKKNIWNDGGAADVLFSSMKSPSVRACSSMIRGYAKFCAADAVNALYMQLRDRNEQLDVATYNAVLYSVAAQHANLDEKWHYALDVLKDMAAAGVSPNIDTFNSILYMLMQYKKLTVARTWSMSVLSEINQCGLEPSLTTWSHLINIHYAHPDSQSPLLSQIIDHLNGRQLSLRHPSDYEFFGTAMETCFENLKDLDLAYKIDALLNEGNNQSLLGYSTRITIYYSSLMRLLCMFAQIDTVMTYYDKLTPHVFTPTYSVASELLVALDLNDGFQYLPKLWSDIKLFTYEKLNLLTEQLLVIMAKKRHEKQLQDLCLKVVDDIRLESADTEYGRPRVSNLSGKALGCMAQIYLHGDNFADSWDVMETYIVKRNVTDGFPSESSLMSVIEACIELRDVTKTLKVLSLMADFAYPKFEEFVTRVQSTLELTDEQQRQIEDM